MRRLLPLLSLLSLLALAAADEDARPNALTAEEAADGWLLLFDGTTTFGWDSAGEPHVADGTLVVEGDKDLRAATTTHFLDYELHFDYRIEKGGANSVKLVRDKDARIPLAVYDGWAEARCTFTGSSITGTLTYKDSGSASFAQSTTGTHIEPRPVLFEVAGGTKLSLRNVKLKPLSTKSIFNGKDLSGWKKYQGDAKRAKSRFTVTKEGCLGVKDGPGDLQTTDAWADFVLQLECRTNGDNLNSGVFFRCLPGDYQQGYEAQVQNQAAKEPKTYTVEEYDPRTHELKGKNKVENWSADYGTGAIYRRVPARRAVAKDREWFTLTVAARGRHIATWVNGVQVVDWTDNRPEKDNARNGCRLGKGPISLQGHDPTTDLSFRNLRIADLGDRD